MKGLRLMKNKYTVVSLFSGGGGLDLGFKNAGFDIIYASDIDKDAVESYKRNVSKTINCEDINAVDVSNIPDSDIIVGGPPCQAFSLAGKRDVNDPRATLVFKYFDIIKAKMPKAFILENVTGILSAKTKEKTKVIDDLKKLFESIGYKLQYQVLEATDFGVPQKRRRVILVGTTNNLVFNYPVPTHGVGKHLKPIVSVYDALSDLPNCMGITSGTLEYRCEPMNEYQTLMRKNSSVVTDHHEPHTSELDKYIISYVKPGGNYMDIPPEVNSVRIRRLQRDGGHTTCYGRLDPNLPSYTINTYFNRPNVGCNIHYEQDRLITLREALRLQSFPDDYLVVAKSKQKKNMIVGNAVPPLLAHHIALSVLKMLEDR